MSCKYTNLFHQLMLAYRRTIAGVSPIFKSHHQTVAQYDVIGQLGIYGESSRKELADRALVTKGNMAQILSKMENCH